MLIAPDPAKSLHVFQRVSELMRVLSLSMHDVRKDTDVGGRLITSSRLGFVFETLDDGAFSFMLLIVISILFNNSEWVAMTRCRFRIKGFSLSYHGWL